MTLSIHTSFDSLHALQIVNHFELTDAGFQEILSRCPHIETLHIQNCPYLTNGSLERLSQLPHLRTLFWIGNISATETGYQTLLSSTSLRTLNLSGSHLTNPACSTLLTHSFLTALDVSFCPLDDRAFSHFQAPLIYLNLRGCPNLTDQTLLTLSRLPTLKHLLLAYHSRMTPEGLRLLPPLQTLRISHCLNIS